MHHTGELQSTVIDNVHITEVSSQKPPLITYQVESGYYMYYTQNKSPQN